jgi:hypothetical protein
MALVAASLAGCEVDQAPIQRDVYAGQTVEQAMQSCIADWGNQELCTKIADTKAQEAAEKQHASSGSHSGGSFIYIQGPGYTGGNRAVTYGGTRYAPVSATNPSFHSAPVATSGFSKSGAFTGSVARGGFGGVGHAAGGSSS